jgi:hypothetical protein
MGVGINYIYGAFSGKEIIMQLTELAQAIDLLRSSGWKVQPPIKRARTIAEAMPSNRKRSLAAKRMWKRRKKAA